ncbi:MAG: helix-turn-helix domain-containing protein [Lentisphaeria bacterium]|nr:helix-turn-helix domain-containing protein [Lentisphaeria bacterium]
MDEDHGRLEEALSALERKLALPVTVIDNAFFLNRKNIFTHSRRSHRKNPACEAGFCERCVRHCRYTMNSRCRREAGPFPAECWKGLVQAVAPLRYGNIHYGMLYLGLWRGGEPEAELPPEFFRRRGELAPPPPDLPALLSLAQLCADGLMMHLLKTRLLDTVPDERGARIAAFLRENAARPIGLEDLAAELGLSRSRTSFAVKKIFGESFSRLLQAERVERAKHYLAGSAEGLHAIAPDCGFSDEFHLSRVFKQHTGLTPSEFRRRHRQ